MKCSIVAVLLSAFATATFCEVIQHDIPEIIITNADGVEEKIDEPLFSDQYPGLMPAAWSTGCLPEHDQWWVIEKLQISPYPFTKTGKNRLKIIGHLFEGYETADVEIKVFYFGFPVITFRPDWCQELEEMDGAQRCPFQAGPITFDLALPAMHYLIPPGRITVDFTLTTDDGRIFKFKGHVNIGNLSPEEQVDFVSSPESTAAAQAYIAERLAEEQKQQVIVN